MIQFVILQLCHFTNQAQGDSRKFKYSNFTQKLILDILFNTNTKCCGILTKILNARAFAMKIMFKTTWLM